MRIILILSLVVCANAMGGGSLFTSSANVFSLFSVEKDFASVVKDYVSEQRQRLAELDALADNIFNHEVPESDLKMSPTQSFGIIKRLVNAVDQVKETLHARSEELDTFLTSDELPSHDDLAGAAEGLLRLQRVYDVPSSKLLAEAEGEDYLFIGKKAYEQGDYASAEEWLKTAVQALNSTSSRADAFDYLSYVMYKLGDYQSALEYAEDMLSLDPTNARIADNIEFYQTHLDEQKSSVVKQKNYNVDNYLRHSDRDQRYFRRLCRGEVLYKPTVNLKCYYSTFNKPELLLKPIAIEQLHEGRQKLVMIRNFASKEECEHLKTTGQQYLQRAVAWEDGKFRPVKFRISTAAWLQPDHDEVIARLDKRMWQATQLNLEYAEALQVSNYGLGGFYENHFDYHGRKKELPPEGDRLATFMIYVFDVEAGGFTAFPRLGVAARPTGGDAVFWYDLWPSGEGDEDTLHGACPVLSGSKWVANRWIHEKNNMCRIP